ncbi:C-type lectin domain family 4 member E-like [Patiria miniata]|uniref:C-type lectin domain-containing protein n=1 Tax=Patiria miniata TaxID=46514 RepID=A0A913ZJX5_PATMI|nr:C-type lectin domain family 4 member E-like [Patiria miniata]
MHSSVFTIFACVSITFVAHVASEGCRPWNAGPPCPSKWHHRRASCYLITESTIKWSDARAECGNLGGVLAVPRSQEEHDFIMSFLPGYGGRAWIDCNDQTTEGIWGCTEGGVEVQYRNWDRGQAGKNAAEDCAVIRSDLLGWHDFPCHFLIPAVCKKPAM